MHLVLLVLMLASLMHAGAFSVRNTRLGARNARSLSVTMLADVSYKQGFMFPGQGAHNVGMAGAVCEELHEAKELLTKVSAASRPCLVIKGWPTI